MFLNLLYNREDCVLIKTLYLLLHSIYCTEITEFEQAKPSETAKNLKTSVQSTGIQGVADMNCMCSVIFLVTSCSVRKVCHNHISQYLKSQGMPQFDSCQLVTATISFQSHPPREKHACLTANVLSGSLPIKPR